MAVTRGESKEFESMSGWPAEMGTEIDGIEKVGRGERVEPEVEAEDKAKEGEVPDAEGIGMLGGSIKLERDVDDDGGDIFVLDVIDEVGPDGGGMDREVGRNEGGGICWASAAEPLEAFRGAGALIRGSALLPREPGATSPGTERPGDD